MTESHDNATCRRATTTDPAVQAVAEAMCPTHREDVPAPLPGHPDPRLRYAACFDCARKAEAAVEAARPIIEAQALRDAADDAGVDKEWFPSEWAGLVAGWLRDRADQIEAD